MVFNGAFDPPQSAVCQPQITEPCALIAAVADFAGNGEGLGVELNGTLDLPQIVVRQPQIAEMRPFVLLVVQGAGSFDARFKHPHPVSGVALYIKIVFHRPDQRVGVLPIFDNDAGIQHRHNVSAVGVQHEVAGYTFGSFGFCEIGVKRR